MRRLARELNKIEEILAAEPERFLSIGEVAAKTNLNRNSTAKYLDILVQSGRARLERSGTAKTYTISRFIAESDLYLHAFDALAIISKQHAITSSNPAFDKMFGDSLEDIPQEITKCIEEKLGHLSEGILDQTITANNNQYEVRFIPITTPHQGESLAVIINDATSQEEKEIKSRLFTTLLDHMHEAVVITEAQLEQPGPQITDVNRATEQLTGYTRHELTQNTPRILQGEKTDKKMLRNLKRSLRQRQSFEGTTTNYRKDGSEYIVNWNIHPVYDKNNNVARWMSIQRNITKSEYDQQALDFHEHQTETIRALLTSNRSAKVVCEQLSDLFEGEIALKQHNKLICATSKQLEFHKKASKNVTRTQISDGVIFSVSRKHTSLYLVVSKQKQFIDYYGSLKLFVELINTLWK